MTTGPYTEGVEFVLDEVIRYARMSAQELIPLIKEIGFNDLKDVKGRMRPVGRPGMRRLDELAERTLEASPFRGRVDLGRAIHLVRTEFGQTFIRADMPNPSEAELQAMFEGWIAEAGADCRRRVHLIPCHLTVTGVDQIQVGPILLKPRRCFDPQFAPELDRYRSRNGERGEVYGEPVAQAAQEYLAAFADVAEVEVPDCDTPTSRLAAEAALQVLVDHIHVLAGASYTKRMRGPGPAIAADRRTAISRVDGELLISMSTQWGGANLSDEAWLQLAAEAETGRLAPLASILQAIVERRDLPLLADRFVDGCAWYGDAAREPSPAAAAVKFVTVMERLLWTGERSAGVTKRVSERLAALCFSVESWDFAEIEAEVCDAYDLRSSVLHGRISKSDPDLVRRLRLCERHARNLLLIWWERFSSGFSADVSLEQLRKHLNEFTAGASVAAERGSANTASP